MMMLRNKTKLIKQTILTISGKIKAPEYARTCDVILKKYHRG